jgi:Domain of unknown function (DU1801)
MAKEAKTQPTKASVQDFMAAVEPPVRQADGETLLALMQAVTGQPPKLWGPSIIGFGEYTYRYDSGHSGVMCRIGFSPRKANLVVYLLDGYAGREEQLARLGKHKIGKSCLYITKLADVDQGVLREMIVSSWAEMAKSYPE